MTTATLWFALVLFNTSGGVAAPFVFTAKIDCEIAAELAKSQSGSLRATCIPVKNGKSTL